MNVSHIFTLALAAVVCSTTSTLAASKQLSPKGAHPQSSLSEDIGTILHTTVLQGGLDGVVIHDLTSGKTLFEDNPDLRLMPASNRKLFTGATALAVLGPRRRFTTRVLATGPIDSDGTLNGDLILRGGGDPLLTAANLGDLASQVAAKIKKFSGKVIADSSLFNGEIYGEGWGVDYLSDDYAPQIYALEVAEGIETITLHGGMRAGDPATYTEDPATDYVHIENHCTTGQPGRPSSFKVLREFNSPVVIITGTVPPGATTRPQDGTVTIDNPPLYAARVFEEKLKDAHIDFSDQPPAAGTTPPTAIPVANLDSLPLSTLLARMNKPSDNLIAESFIRHLAASPEHPGGFAQGHAVEEKFLVSHGISAADHAFADGSGVTRLNLVTARAVVTLLTVMSRRSDFPIFYNSLSIAGVDGTAQHRMIGTPAAGNAHVKTGTVRFCRALSGYVRDRRSHLIAFSILLNNCLAPAKTLGSLQDKIVERLAWEK